MSKEMRSRRKVLKRSSVLALGSFSLVSGGAAGKTSQISTDFDPYEFKQVDRFVSQVFSRHDPPYQKLIQWDETGEMDHVFEELSEDQLVAFMDAIRPAYIKKETRDDSTVSRAFGLFSSSDDDSVVDTEVDSINEDPIKKWGWDEASNRFSTQKEDQRDPFAIFSAHSNPARRAPNSGFGGNSFSSKSISKTISALALSLDIVAYKWQGTIAWDYDGNEIRNVNAYDTIKYTNSVTSHRGTDIDKNEQNEFVQVRFQGKFANGAGKLCDPIFNAVCIDISQKFRPYIQLRGDKNGNGEHIDSGDDAIDGDLVIKEVQENL